VQFAHVLHFALSHPWALDEPYRQIIANALAHHLLGIPDPVALQAAADGRERRREQLPQPRKGGAVALIPIHGPIVPRASMMADVSGLTSTEQITASVREAVADPNIKQIILDIDSPGGSVAGCTECVEAILAARETKPIVAQAHFAMASAAYWIGSAATEIVASPSAQVGSIGVYIFEGKHKVIGKETEPLSEFDQKEIAAKVREYYDLFTADVARSRKVPIANVRNGYGEGRTVGAQQAQALGMVDRIATLEETVARLSPNGLIAAGTLIPEVTAEEIAWRNALFAEVQTATL
jgi:capsid assembly protease